MPSAAAVFGTSFEVILNMTDTLTMSSSQANTNVIVGLSGLSGGKTLTLPLVSQMVAAQNLTLYVSNKSSSGGTITIAAASGDSIAAGPTTCPVARGVILKHDGLKSWFAFG